MEKPIDMPKCLSTVFAVVNTNPLRNAIGAVVFGFDSQNLNPWPLMVLDWSLFQFDELAQELPALSKRVKSLTVECGAVFPSNTICIESGGIGGALEPVLHDCGHEQIEFIPQTLVRLTSQERAAGAAVYAHRGLVMLTEPADEKQSLFQGITRNHLVAQMTSFGITSEDLEASELFSAWCTGILLALENPPRID